MPFFTIILATFFSIDCYFSQILPTAPVEPETGQKKMSIQRPETAQVQKDSDVDGLTNLSKKITVHQFQDSGGQLLTATQVSNFNWRYPGNYADCPQSLLL